MGCCEPHVGAVGVTGLRRGVHPTITVVILVAVTIAIAVAAVGWITGFFQVNMGQATEGIELIPPGSYFDSSNSTAYIRVLIHLKPSVTISDIRVDSANVTDVWVENVTHGSVSVNGGEITASAGSEFTICLKVDKSVPPGAFVDVYLYTDEGYVYHWTIPTK